jgi:hypothetical protein
MSWGAGTGLLIIFLAALKASIDYSHNEIFIFYKSAQIPLTQQRFPEEAPIIYIKSK